MVKTRRFEKQKNVDCGFGPKNREVSFVESLF